MRARVCVRAQRFTARRTRQIETFLQQFAIIARITVGERHRAERSAAKRIIRIETGEPDHVPRRGQTHFHEPIGLGQMQFVKADAGAEPQPVWAGVFDRQRAVATLINEGVIAATAAQLLEEP